MPYEYPRQYENTPVQLSKNMLDTLLKCLEIVFYLDEYFVDLKLSEGDVLEARHFLERLRYGSQDPRG